MNERDPLKVQNHTDGVPKLRELGPVCKACQLAKAHKIPFSGHFGPVNGVGDIVHSDVVGPLVPSFPDHFRYLATVQNDHSRYL